jgi:hypothetical protein
MAAVYRPPIRQVAREAQERAIPLASVRTRMAEDQLRTTPAGSCSAGALTTAAGASGAIRARTARAEAHKARRASPPGKSTARTQTAIRIERALITMNFEKQISNH